MITADLHVHSDFSSDSDTPMEQMIEKAISLGYERICMTDHMDYDFPKTCPYDFVFDPDHYFERLNQLSYKYKNDIKILYGIELGLKPYLSQRYNELLEKYPFDFVIGSTHLVNDIDPYYPEYWENKSEQQGLEQYFDTIIANIKSGANFDICGHIDYIIRYAPSKNSHFSYLEHATRIDEILKTVIQLGKGIEINTAGYKYGLGHPHPQEDIIKRYIELGGTLITIGSDAHKPEHLAFDFTKAREVLLSLGIRQYAVFEKRKPILLPL